jgi:hypothetical protein
MQTTNFIDYKTPEQIAEATRQTVRADPDTDTDIDTDTDAAGAGTAGAPRRNWVDDLRLRGQRLREQGGHYVADQPVRSMVMAAAGGAAITTLMLAALRGSRH